MRLDNTENGAFIENIENVISQKIDNCLKWVQIKPVKLASKF